MTSKQLAAAIGVFGLAVIGSGLIRYLTTPGGENGLYFGLVMGGLAVVGARLAALNQMLAGRIVGGLAVAFVCLWFGYDLYKDSQAANFVFGSAEVRKVIVLALGALTAAALFLPLAARK